jgi:hypothetical protein
MFEVGKFYKVTMWEDGQNGGVLTEYGSAKAIKVAIPLVTFRGVTDKTPVIIQHSLPRVCESRGSGSLGQRWPPLPRSTRSPQPKS